MIRIPCTHANTALRGRIALALCLRCVQAIAPDWPLATLWPFVRLTVTSSMARFSRRSKRTRPGTARS